MGKVVTWRGACWGAYLSDRDPCAGVFILQVASITQAQCVISAGAAGCVNEIVSSATSPGSFLELYFVELGYSRADPLFTHTALYI